VRVCPHLSGSLIPSHRISEVLVATRPTFQRTTRIPPELPKGEVEIPPPPAAPAIPSTSLITLLLPAGATILGLGIMVIGAVFGGGSGGITLFLSLAISLPVMLASYLGSFITYSTQKKTYIRTVHEREEKYSTLLKARQRELSNFRDQQRTALCQTDPEPAECLARVVRLDRRLWERTPQDADFLSLRLGLGARPFAVTVKPPKQEAALNDDPLVQAAQNLAREFTQVPEVPICLPLREAGVAGLAGPRPAILNTARTLAMQIAVHHSPDEIKIVALFPADEAAHWEWLRWLPHVWTDDHNHRFLACEKDAAHRLLASLYELLNRRRLQVAAAKDSAGAPLLPYFVFLISDPRLVENEPILPVLLTSGQLLGTFPIFFADRLEALPKGCQAMAEVGMGPGRLIQIAPSSGQSTFNPDEAPVDLADRMARTMAAIRLQRIATSSEIPNMVTLLDLLGSSTVEDLDVLSRWRSSKPHRSLAVPIGRRTGSEPLSLDLHERWHGPHGLVAGATGSGKSELLQSLVASLAVHFHPHQVAFILIDYKGGGMANAFLELPHVVGTITNLQGNLAMRALAAIKSELQRRQTILARAGVNHIDEYQQRYQQGQAKDPLPHLILVADEFAELKAEQPDFMRELISAVRVGRSLGVHLILATQKPAGVVDEQIWANSRFRICLRVERPEDSQEVLKRPDAASLTGAGRAYFQVGNNEVFELFQAAWGGAPYVPGGYVASDPHEIVEVALDGSRHPLRLSSRPMVIQAAGTQLQALVAYLRDVAQREGINRLPGPWLQPLPERVTLEQARPAEGWDGKTWRPTTTWLEPAVGLVDDPAHQAQGPLRLNLGKEGHLAIYGAPGTGKTTLVQSLVTSLALTHSPQDVHLYLLDFGGRLLTLFTPLPHVGGVILTDESERLHRLLRYLLREMESRKERFARAGVNTLVSYRNATKDHLPAIVVVLDNYTGFANTYTDAEDLLAQIAREGGNLGIHLVLTANSPSAIKTKISGSITLAVTLPLADRSEYSLVVGRTGGLEPASILGRGLVKGNPPLEFQTALPAGGDTEAKRTAALKDLIEQLSRAWSGPRARPVPALPDVVPLCDLIPVKNAWPTPPADGSLAVPVGLDVNDLEPLLVDLNDGPHFLVTGPIQSGKTTFLQSWLLALAEQFSPQRLHLYLVDFRRAGLFPLSCLPHVQAYLEDDDRLGEALAGITQILRERRQSLEEARRAASGLLDERTWLAGHPAVVVAIEDFDTFRDEAQVGTKERLEQLVRRERGLGFYLLLAGSSSDLSSSWEGLVKALKEWQTGFLLGSSDHDDLQLLNIRLPMGEAGKPLAPGEGFYARRGRYRKLKAVTCQAGATALAAWVERIRQRSTG